MTRDEVISRVLARLGNRGADTALKTELIEELKLVQEELESEAELPWFLLSERSTATATVGEQRLPVPGDFLREFEDGALYVIDASGVEYELRKTEYDRARATYAVDETGRTKHYALVNPYFWLFPIPDLAYTYKLTYYKKGTVLSTDVSNVWTTYAADLVIAELGTIAAAQYLHDENGGKAFAALALRAKTRMLDETQARLDANRELMTEADI